MSLTFNGNNNGQSSSVSGHIVPIPSVDPNGGLNINLLGDVTIVNHHQLNPMGAIGMQRQAIGMMQQMMGVQQQMIAAQLECGKMQLEEMKLNLAANVAKYLGDPNHKGESVLIDKGESETDRLLPQSLRSKLLAEDADCKIIESKDINDINGGEKFHLDKKEPYVKPIREFFEEPADVTYEVVDADTYDEMNKPFNVKDTIFRTLLKVDSDRIMEDLVKQEKDGINPTLFSNNDGLSVIVSFILVQDGDWRSKVKESIKRANSMLSNSNFFKEAQEYLFFIYESTKNTRANCAVFITPTTINKFLKLTSDNPDIKRYDYREVKQACSQYTDDVFRIIEPIVPSSSKIEEIFGPNDFRYNHVTINPLYSKSIDSIRISANLASASTIKL